MFDYTYPHTNLSDMNLDYLLKQIKIIQDNIKDLDSRVKSNLARIEKNELDIITLNNEVDNINDEIARLRTEIEDFENLVNNQFAEFKTEIYSYLNNQIARFKAEIEADILAFKNEINQHITDTENRLNQQQNAYEALVNIKLAEMADNITHLLDIINTRYEAAVNVSKEYTDIQADLLQQQIDELKDIGVHTDTTTPATLIREFLQNTLDTEHHYLRAWALTAKEYDDLDLTAEAYDNYNINVYDYDYLAKWYLREKQIVGFMINPLTGLKDTNFNVINDIVSHLLRDNALTAEEYDIKELEAADYDSKEITAYNYDFYAKVILA